MEGQKKLIILGIAWEKRLEEKVEGVYLQGWKKGLALTELSCVLDFLYMVFVFFFFF